MPFLPVIGIDETGVVHLIYTASQGVYYTNNASGVFSTPQVVPGISLWESKFTMVVDGSGKVHIAFKGKSPSDTWGDIYYTNNASGAWIPPTKLSEAGIEYNVSLAVDHNGNAHIIYDRLASPTLCYVNNQSGSFSSPSCFTGGRHDEPPNIALDAEGNVHITYLITGGLSGGVMYANNLTGIFRPLLLADFSDLPTSRGVGQRWFTIGSDNKLHLVFHAGTREDPVSFEIYYFRSDPISSFEIYLPLIRR